MNSSVRDRTVFVNVGEQFALQDRTKNSQVRDVWEKEQKRRKQKIKEVCLKNNVEIKERENKLLHFFYDPTHRLLVCNNAKVGSSTWRLHFLNLANLPEEEKQRIKDHNQIHKTVHTHFAVTGDPGDLAKQTVSFSFVRHPYERLVSAYYTLKDKYQIGSFTTFVHLILNETSSLSLSPSSSKNGFGYPPRDHWLPFSSFCDYCNIQYAVIGKMETFQEDVLHISQAAGVVFQSLHVNKCQGRLCQEDSAVNKSVNEDNGADKSVNEDKAANKSVNDDNGDKKLKRDNNAFSNSQNDDTNRLTKKHFNELPRNLIENLYKMYQNDFDMFEYDPRKYSSSN